MNGVLSQRTSDARAADSSVCRFGFGPDPDAAPAAGKKQKMSSSDAMLFDGDLHPFAALVPRLRLMTRCSVDGDGVLSGEELQILQSKLVHFQPAACCPRIG